MDIKKITCYRYYSDFSGFDFVVIFEDRAPEKAAEVIDDIIGTWFEGEGDCYYIPLIEYLEDELKSKGYTVSIYNTIDNEE